MYIFYIKYHPKQPIMYSLSIHSYKPILRFTLYLLLSLFSLTIYAQQPVLSLPIGHSRGINGISFSKDGKLMVSGSDDNSIIIWDARSGYVIRRIMTNAPVKSVSFTPDGLSVITTSGLTSSFSSTRKPQLELWDIKTGKSVKKLNFTSPADLHFLPGSGYLLVPDYSADVDGNNPGFFENAKRASQMSDEEDEALQEKIDARVEEELKKIGINEDDEMTAAQLSQVQKIYSEISLKMRFGVSGAVARNLSILDYPAQKVLGQLDFVPNNYQVISYNGAEYILTASKKQAMGGDNKEITAFEIKNVIRSSAAKTTTPVFKTFRATGHGSAIATSPSGGLFSVACEENNSVEVFQMEKTGGLGKLTYKGKEFWKMEFSPNGNHIYIFSKDGNYRFVERWNTAGLQQDLSLSLTPGWLTGNIAMLSPLEDYFVVSSEMGLQKYSVSGVAMGQFTNRTFTPSNFEFSENDKQVNVVYNSGMDARSLLKFAVENEIREKEAADNKKTGATERQRLIDERLREYGLLTDGKTYKGLSIGWDITRGNILPAGDLAIKNPPKKRSANGKYELADKKIIWTKNESNKLIEMLEMDEEDADGKEKEEIRKAKEMLQKTVSSSGDSLSLPVILLINRATKDTASLILIDSTDWMIVLKNGYYMSSPNAAKAVSYTRGLDVIGFDQLDLKNNRPDIVLKAIGMAEPVLTEAYRNAWKKRLQKNNLDSAQFNGEYSVPETWIDGKEKINYEQTTNKLFLKFNAQDPKSKLSTYNIWVNDVPVFGKKGVNIRQLNSNKISKQVEITLSQGSNRIEVAVMNVNGIESYKSPMFVHYTPEKNTKPVVYFAGIGIDRFNNSKYNLKYSAADIRKLCEILKKKYSNIIIDTLLNENVTIANVQQLRQKLLQTFVDDKVIISYSGHGMLSKNFDYFLSTYAVNFDNPVENGLPYEELEALVDSIPSRKKLLLIDACHSGEVDKEDLMRINKVGDSLKLVRGVEPLGYKAGKMGLKNSFELMQNLFTDVRKSTGAVIITAASGTQFAQEADKLGNGIFTFSLIKTLNENPAIRVSQLKTMVEDKVVSISAGQQRPTSRNSIVTSDWTL